MRSANMSGKGRRLFADDTPVKLIGPRQQTDQNQARRLGPMFAMNGLGTVRPRLVRGISSPRSQGPTWPANHLSDYRGWVHADGYAGFNGIVR